jgi:hypothetical protein
VALEAERAIAGQGYETQVGGGPGAPTPILSLTRSLILEPRELRAVRTQLEAFARKFGGSYYGWLPPMQRPESGA